VHLGCTEETQQAWQDSKQRLLQALERHLEEHDFILGGRPSLADFALLGPVYVHFYRDPVDGFELRKSFPLVCEWVDRTNAEGCINARRYGQRLYSLGPDGSLVGREAMSDDGAWLPDDQVPATLEPIISIFFEEMWPYLCSSMEALTKFIASDDHVVGSKLPRKSFSASRGFEPLQTGEGPLTVGFRIGGIPSRRMVVPTQIWMLQRLQAAMDGGDRQTLENWLGRFPRGPEILDLHPKLSGCRINKVGGRLLSAS
jgi:hypothetical protein